MQAAACRRRDCHSGRLSTPENYYGMRDNTALAFPAQVSQDLPPTEISAAIKKHEYAIVRIYFCSSLACASFALSCRLSPAFCNPLPACSATLLISTAALAAACSSCFPACSAGPFCASAALSFFWHAARAPHKETMAMPLISTFIDLSIFTLLYPWKHAY